MSKQNKVNKSNYDQAGRLTPDDLARERKNQGEMPTRSKGKERVTAKAAAPAASRPRSGRGERG
jgi:hypothetical protein